MMLRTHTRPARQALALALIGAMLVAPTTAAAKPKKTATAAKPAAPAAPPESDGPDAGDGDIADEPLEAGQLGPATGLTRKSAAKPSVGMARRSSVEQGLELSDQGDQAFDAGDFLTAARLYGQALGLLAENATNHLTRAVVLANAVTTHEQLYLDNRELNHLRTAQRLLEEYLRACRAKHGTGCDRYPETQEARARLLQISTRIDEAAPRHNKIPPEIGAAPGGRPYDLSVEQPPPPGWIAPAIAGGLVLAGGGAAVIYHGATADKFGPIYPRDGHIDDTGTDTEGTGTEGGGATLELTPQLRGKLLMGVGVFMAAAGIGFAVLGSMRLAKHRRLNRLRAQSLALVPAVGRGSAGFAVSGRF